VTNVTVDDFVRALKKCHREIISEKGDNLLFCPSVFDPRLSSETDRGLANVVYVNGIWLDFDYGHLTHRDMASMFPMIRMVAFNSFSSTKTQPRYRLYIPTSRTMTAEEYRFLTGQIVQVAKDNGYRMAQKDIEKPHLKAHGIDLSKLNAASLFYLPCQPKDPKGRIWKDHNGSRRKPFDVDEWFENAITIETDYVEPDPTQDGSEDTRLDRERVRRALDRWNALGVQEGQGDRELFTLHRELKAANVPDFERRECLLQAARTAHSPADRIRQAHRLMQLK